MAELDQAERITSPLCLRFDAVRKRIAAAALACGRLPEDIALVAVSKYQPPEAVAELALHWLKTAPGSQPCFGENYVQEALDKQAHVRLLLQAASPDLEKKDICWHFTGHLQSNKAKQTWGYFSLLHTLDSENLARILHNTWIKHKENSLADAVKKAPLPVLLQVNIGEEAQKSGVEVKNVQALAKHVITELPGLSLKGLMCLPPAAGDSQAVRPYFAALRTLRDALEQKLSLALPCLSMGMSGDLEVAIEEGATIVRIGTDIFGPRLQ